MDALIAKLTETYAAIDVALAQYSEARNSDNPLVCAGADAHYAEAERLRGEAHKITAALSRPA